MGEDTTPASPDQGPELPGSRRGGSPDAAAEPGQLLGYLARLRRQARAARHAYWFPLVLFGLLTLVATPLYAAAMPTGWYGFAPLVHLAYAPLTRIPVVSELWAGPTAFLIGWYWTLALAIGYLLTVLWYRWHGRQAGVETRAHGYLVTGLVLTVLAAVLPMLLFRPPFVLPWLLNLWITGTLAYLIIAAGLWVLAWAERSRGLALIAGAYTAVTLLIGAYNVTGPPGGFSLRPGLANEFLVLLLPAILLLVAGLASFFTQEARR
jgi:hypothetical protein